MGTQAKEEVVEPHLHTTAGKGGAAVEDAVSPGRHPPLLAGVVLHEVGAGALGVDLVKLVGGLEGDGALPHVAEDVAGSHFAAALVLQADEGQWDTELAARWERWPAAILRRHWSCRQTRDSGTQSLQQAGKGVHHSCTLQQAGDTVNHSCILHKAALQGEAAIEACSCLLAALLISFTEAFT